MEKDIVILAGSGRSGTTWLGSILNSYPGTEYFYEIHAFDGLDFEQADLLKKKNPYTFFLRRRSVWALKAERRLLGLQLKTGIASASARRALRLQYTDTFKKSVPSVHLYKIVNLFEFARRIEELNCRFGRRMKIVYIMRNPFSQVVSQMRIQKKMKERSKQHFKKLIANVIDDPLLKNYLQTALKYKEGSWLEQMLCIWWVSNDLMIRTNYQNMYSVIYENLAMQPMVEIRKIFKFLGWPVLKQTYDFILKTSYLEKSEPGDYSIKKNAKYVIHRWKNEININDYFCAKSLLSSCELMNYWNEDDLVLNEK